MYIIYLVKVCYPCIKWMYVYTVHCTVYTVYTVNCTLGRFKKYFFSQIITSIHLFVAPVAKKSPQKILGQNLFGKPLRMATPFFGSLIQVKFRKMAFLARSFHFMFLEPCFFNINGRKAFCLFWVSKLYGHAKPVFWPHPIFTGEILKNGFFSPIRPFYVLGTLLLQ